MWISVRIEVKKLIVFRHDILKASKLSSIALQRLRRFITHNEGDLIAFLVNMWKYQGQAITYKELREAILYGELTEELLTEWRRDYAKFVIDKLLPKWQLAMDKANEDLYRKYPKYYFNPMHKGIVEWNNTRAAAFVTKETGVTIQGLRAVIKRAAELNDLNVDELGRVIRPMVGLNHRQTIANLNYYEKMIKDGVKPDKAYEKSVRYAARQHRYRGQMIARTELSFSYNQGAYYGAKQAQEQGLLGRTVKVWCTADIDTVCETCNALEGKEIEMDELFDFNTNITDPKVKLSPPAHPHCMCTIIYKEVEPPLQLVEPQTELL